MKAKSARQRLDLLVVERGLADSTKAAQGFILAGEVKVAGKLVTKAGVPVPVDAAIELAVRQKYASRGGLKLEGALRDFSINPAEKVCFDIGSSTGGFTDCLLQHGATKVVAVDVNISQLDWKLCQDPRVVSIEMNARNLSPPDIADPADLVVVDVSFISVRKVLPPVAACAKPGADLLILIKPQFELPRTEVRAGGIVEDEKLHRKAVQLVQKAAGECGLQCLEAKAARIRGTEGNQEFFLHARRAQ